MRLPALVLALLCAIVPAWSQSMPEFGASVIFPKGEEPVTIAAARTVGGLPGKGLEDDLLTIATTRLTDLETKARDAADPQRYVAFMGLRDLTTQLRGLPPAKAAQKAVGEIAKDKTIAREQKAENAWRGLLATVEKQPKEKRGEAMKASIPGFIKAYEGTHFARIAGESAH